MRKQLAGLFTAAAFIVAGPAMATGTLYNVEPQSSGTVLAGTGGFYNPYDIGSVGPFASTLGKLLEVRTQSVGASFTDFITFTLPTLSDGSVAPMSFLIDGGNVSYFSAFSAYLFAGPVALPGATGPGYVPYSAALGSVTFTQPGLWTNSSTSGSFTAPNLAGGNYFLAVEGVRGGSTTAYDLRIQAVPVPEPDALALLLAGLAFVGMVVKKRSAAQA